MKRRLNELLDKLDWSLKMLDSFLITRDPAAAKSAEAFDGMRSRIEEISRERHRYVMQLVTLHRLANSTSGDNGVSAALRDQINDFIAQEQIVVVDAWDPKTESLFEVAGRGDSVAVVTPAYVDGKTGYPLKTGQAERTKAARPEQTEDTQEETEDTHEQTESTQEEANAS